MARRIQPPGIDRRNLAFLTTQNDHCQKNEIPPEAEKVLVSREGRFDPILGRIDLIAILTAVLGVCLLGVAAVVMALIELARLISSLWSDSFDRWLLISLGVALIWVAVRLKKLCVF
jgi:hypothetical protein